jgi:hypothetical protein
MSAEAAAGHRPRDVSAENRGYDIESRGADGTLRFIEVKGRAAVAAVLNLNESQLQEFGGCR